MDEIKYLYQTIQYVTLRVKVLSGKKIKTLQHKELLNKFVDYLKTLKNELELWQLKNQKREFQKLKKVYKIKSTI